MALSSTSSYVPVSADDPQFLTLLRSFKGVSNVTDFAKDLMTYLNLHFATISGRFSVGGYSCNTWYAGTSGAVTAWPDSEGWGRHLLGNFIVGKKLLAHLHYPIESEIRSALGTPSAVLQAKLANVDIPVTVSSPFPYKVSRSAAKAHALNLGRGDKHTEDLIFCIGNYLGRLPDRAEVFGQKSLPIAAVRANVLSLDTGTDTTANEVRLATLNLRGRNKMGDPVEGVYFKTRAVEIRTVASFIFSDTHLDLVLTLPGVQLTILRCLQKYPVNAETFEDRVDGLVYVQAQVRRELSGLLPFKREVDLDTVLRNAVTLPGEIFRGDAKTIQPRHEKNTIGGVLMKVGSRFSVAEYSDLTRKLVAALLNANLHLEVSYTQAVLIILQRYIHYRTNALRFVNLPSRLDYYMKSRVHVVDFSRVDDVFASYQCTIPEIERAWCAPLAGVAYMLLKDTGGSFAKWKDLPNIPSHMNFDFVGYVNPIMLSKPEMESLSTLTARFRNKSTPVRGFKLGARLTNPIDHMVSELNLGAVEAQNLRRLVG
uniref:p60 n=1 Tax=Grapevine leafroll-associated virus Carn TaxID=659661 RepID=D2E4B0_9VIRU|nr:p60 [Grapevine leafroll-associated virus Carn]